MKKIIIGLLLGWMITGGVLSGGGNRMDASLVSVAASATPEQRVEAVLTSKDKIAGGTFATWDGKVKWAIDKKGHLLIVGNGDFKDWSYPWLKYPEQVITAELHLERVVDATIMFANMKNLRKIDMRGFDASILYETDSMFKGCESLESVDLSHFNSGNFRNMNHMFEGCKSLKTVKFGPMDLENSHELWAVFKGCESLEEVDLHLLKNTHRMSKMTSLFEGCASLKSVDLSKMNMYAVYEADAMFKDCKSLKTLDLSKCKPKVLKTTVDMFRGCSQLESLNLTGFNFEHTSDFSYMFAGCEQLEQMTWSCFKGETYKICNMKKIDGMFENCKSLKTIDLSGLVTPYIETMDHAFSGCSSLENLYLWDFNHPKVTYTPWLESMRGTFQNCTSLKQIDISKINISTICDAENAFGGCGRLESVIIPPNFRGDIKLPKFEETDRWYMHDGTEVTSVPEVTNHAVEIMKNKIPPLPSVTFVFKDVPKGNWYVDYIQYVFDKELMRGDGTYTYFYPEENITKAQVAQVLYNMENTPEVTEHIACKVLQDVYYGEWYDAAVCWAYDNGIITGDTNTLKFYPDSNVTREQLALMFCRYADYKGLDITGKADLSQLVHSENVSNWAEDGVQWAVEVGLISGLDIYKDGAVIARDLAPQGNATRAQVAAIMMRFLEEPKVQQPAKPEGEEEEAPWLYEVNEDGTITIVDYDGSTLTGDLIIPTEIDGKQVTAIGEAALSNLSVNSITVPKEIKSIGDFAFRRCTHLRTVFIEGGVEMVGEKLFDGCKGLFSDGVEKVVFLEEASAYTAWAKEGVFEGVEAKFFYPAENATWTKEMQDCFGQGLLWDAYCTETDEDGVVWMYQKTEENTAVLLGYLGCPETYHMSVPEQVAGLPVTEIVEKAFAGTNVENVALPESIEIIGEAAFEGAERLTGISIPSKVEEIKDHTFDGCRLFAGVEFKGDLKRIGNSAFYGCGSMEEIQIPETVTTIGDYAFRECGDLKGLVIPKSVESLGVEAFASCSTLRKLELPETLQNIGDMAFAYCPDLTHVRFSDVVPSMGENVFDSVEATVYYPAEKDAWTEEKREDYGGTLTWVAYEMGEDEEGHSWIYCEGTEDTVQLVAPAEKMETLVLPTKIAGKTVSATVPCAFEVMEGLTEVTIPKEFTNIGPEAFVACNDLKKATVESPMTVLTERMFTYCHNLETVLLPDTLETIGELAFYCCYNLKNVEIPENVKVLEEFAFSCCNRLEEVILSDNVKVVGRAAFLGCEGLRTVVLPKELESLGVWVFSDCPQLVNVQLPETLTVIPEEAFRNCYMLKEIDIPKTVTVIEDRAFQFCENLENIVIPKQVTSVGKSVFYGCTSLKKVVFEGSVPSMKENVFGKVSAKIYYPAKGAALTDEKKESISYGSKKLIWIGI